MNPRGKMLQVKWFGLSQTSCVKSAKIDDVEDLITKQMELVHSTRLKKFAEKRLGLAHSISRPAKQNLEAHQETMTKHLGLHFNAKDRQFEVQHRWRGLGHERPSSELSSIFWKDMHEMLAIFLAIYLDQDFVALAKAM